MSVFTAAGGKADWAPGVGGTSFANIPELRTWDLRVNKTSKEYASSSTGGGKQNLAGAENFSGTLNVYLDRTTTGGAFDVDHGITEGAVGVLKLYESASKFFLAPAYIDEISYSVPIEDDSLVACSITYKRNGALVRPTAAT
jgi:hypothetical protein